MSEPNQAPWRVPAALAGLPAAVAFLTRVPVPLARMPAAAWGWAVAWFPLVGAGLGLVASVVVALLAPAGALVAAVTSLAVLALLTGALHEDGLADTADALGGGRDREAVLAILKDSRIGSYGALALGLSVLLRAAALARLGPNALWAWPLVAALARLAPVLLLAWLPYVTPASTSRSATMIPTDRRVAWIAAFIAACTATGVIVACVAVAPSSARAVLGAVLATFVAILLCGWRFRVRMGGLTGDFLGAAEQVAEVFAFVALAALN